MIFLLPQVIAGLRGIESINPSVDALRDLLNDTTIVSQINADKAMVFYMGSPHGYNWCIVCKDSNQYHVFNGTDNTKSLANSQILDTSGILQQRSDILDWGFNYLPRANKAVIPKTDVLYNPICWRLKLYKKNVQLFEINNNMLYNGSDSICFTKNLRDLIMVLYYLSSPDLREYLPLEITRKGIK